MQFDRPKCPFSVLALIIFALFSGLASLQAGSQSAEAIISNYVEAAGGKKAMAKLTSRVSKGEFAMPAFDVYAEMEVYIKPPNRVFTSVDGEMATSGVNGDVAWSINPMEGARVLTGSQKAGALRQALLNPLVRWKDHFTTAKVAGEAKIGESTCTRVDFTTKEGEVVAYFLDQKTHLVLGMEESIDGAVFETRVSDYREVDGVKLPFAITVEGSQFSFEITLESVEHNVEIPDSKFDLPSQIQIMVNQ